MRSVKVGTNTISDVMKSIRRITRAMDVRSKRVAIETGLTIPQIILLQSLDHFGELTTQQISAQANLSPSTTVIILDRLELRGLVKRRRSTVDRRVVHSRLTAKGKRVLANAPVPFDDRFVRAFSGLSAAERRALVSALATIADLLDGSPDDRPVDRIDN